MTGYTNKFVEELHGCKVINDVLQNMQTDAKIWSTLLHISGGKLALHKCLYYIVSWIWKRQGACIVPAKAIQPKIMLDDDTHPTQIKHLDCHLAHRTLGQYKAPNGQQTEHLQYMEKKSNAWLLAIKEARLTKREALSAYETIWLPSLAYGLGTINISHKELDRLQRPIINRILPILGYNRHLPRAVVFGNSKFGGLNLHHLYIEQGTQHVTQFIKYYRNGGSIGKLLRILLRWIHAIAGFSFCPLARPHPGYHHIEDKWYQTLIRFLYKFNVSIQTDESIQIHCRENYSCLMEDFLLQDPSP